MKFNFSFGDFSRFSFSLGVPFFNKTFRGNLDFYKTPDKFALGIHSRCADGLHVLFFDYDFLTSEEVEADIKRLQKEFMLSSAFVFVLDRLNSYHVIILDKFSLHDAFKIIQQANVDAAFMYAPDKLFSREWVLRISSKGNRKSPEFLRLIKSEWNLHQISSAHKKFLEQYYGVPELQYACLDGLKELPVIRYNTGNRTA